MNLDSKAQMIVITGGAGFIGSNIAAALARRGERIAIYDWLGTGDKWKNITKHRVWDIAAPENCQEWLLTHKDEIAAVVHMGALSSTTETDVDLIVRLNLRLSLDLWESWGQRVDVYLRVVRGDVWRWCQWVR
jgi:ADP-L-glycero-D-manno-heptose 6-epimerase